MEMESLVEFSAGKSEEWGVCGESARGGTYILGLALQDITGLFQTNATKRR